VVSPRQQRFLAGVKWLTENVVVADLPTLVTAKQIAAMMPTPKTGHAVGFLHRIGACKVEPGAAWSVRDHDKIASMPRREVIALLPGEPKSLPPEIPPQHVPETADDYRIEFLRLWEAGAMWGFDPAYRLPLTWPEWRGLQAARREWIIADPKADPDAKRRAKLSEAVVQRRAKRQQTPAQPERPETTADDSCGAQGAPAVERTEFSGPSQQPAGERTRDDPTGLPALANMAEL
jgi:hypothetical protein